MSARRARRRAPSYATVCRVIDTYIEHAARLPQHGDEVMHLARLMFEAHQYGGDVLRLLRANTERMRKLGKQDIEQGEALIELAASTERAWCSIRAAR